MFHAAGRGEPLPYGADRAKRLFCNAPISFSRVPLTPSGIFPVSPVGAPYALASPSGGSGIGLPAARYRKGCHGFAHAASKHPEDLALGVP